jgi:hypothetical protein
LDLGKNNADGAAWAAYRPNLTTYQVPSEITKTIGGGATGGATLIAPTGGFKERDLQIQFQRTYSPTPRAPTRYIPPATGAAQPQEDKKGNGAVIGGAVGGVAAVLLVGAIAFIVFYRRRRAQQAQSPHDRKDRPVSELPTGSAEHLKSPSDYTPLQSHLSPYGSPPQDGSWNGWGHPAPAYPGQPPNNFSSDTKHASILQEPQELPAIEPQELPASPYIPGVEKKTAAASASTAQPPPDIHPALKSSATAESAGLPSSPKDMRRGPSVRRSPGEGSSSRKTIIKHV